MEKKETQFYFFYDLANKVKIPEQNIIAKKLTTLEKIPNDFGLFATEDIPKFAIMYPLLAKEIQSSATKYTIQYDHKMHIVDGTFLQVARWVNHCCTPNVNFFFIDARFYVFAIWAKWCFRH